jgi:hypothetical protein
VTHEPKMSKQSFNQNEVTSDLEDETGTPVNLGTQTHLAYTVVIYQGKLHTDLMGRFPVISSKGNWYVMVCYSYDCHYVKSVPMKSGSASEWLKAYCGIHQELSSKGLTPKLHTLENEAYVGFESYFAENDVGFQLVPPHCPIRSGAEPVIRTFKEHFVAGLASVDPDLT